MIHSLSLFGLAINIVLLPNPRFSFVQPHCALDTQNLSFTTIPKDIMKNKFLVIQKKQNIKDNHRRLKMIIVIKDTN